MVRRSRLRYSFPAAACCSTSGVICREICLNELVLSRKPSLLNTKYMSDNRSWIIMACLGTNTGKKFTVSGCVALLAQTSVMVGQIVVCVAGITSFYTTKKSRVDHVLYIGSYSYEHKACACHATALVSWEPRRSAELITCHFTYCSFFPSFSQQRQKTCSSTVLRLWWVHYGLESRGPLDKWRLLHAASPCWEDRRWSDMTGDWREPTLHKVSPNRRVNDVTEGLRHKSILTVK